MTDYGQRVKQRGIHRLPGGLAMSAKSSPLPTNYGLESKPCSLSVGRDMREGEHPTVLWLQPARAFKHPLCITLLQIARNPFFFFWLVFLVTRRDAARLARRVGFWARRAGD